jgi:hypothetical protein
MKNPPFLNVSPETKRPQESSPPGIPIKRFCSNEDRLASWERAEIENPQGHGEFLIQLPHRSYQCLTFHLLQNPENGPGLDLLAQVETGIGILETMKENRLGRPP